MKEARRAAPKKAASSRRTPYNFSILSGPVFRGGRPRRWSSYISGPRFLAGVASFAYKAGQAFLPDLNTPGRQPGMADFPGLPERLRFGNLQGCAAPVQTDHGARYARVSQPGSPVPEPCNVLDGSGGPVLVQTSWCAAWPRPARRQTSKGWNLCAG